VMIAAIQKANSADPAKYLPELAKISVDGISGKIEFDAKGDIKSGNITLYEVKSGKLEVLSTQTTEAATPAAAAPAKQ
jgi:branched-chain amino acid transport system substrate-binding protein